MKNLRKSLAIFLSLTFVIAVSQICFRSSDVNAANHGKYKDVAKIYDQGSCPSMQGMAVHGDYIYACKINNSTETSAVVARVNKETGNTVYLTNSASGTIYFSDFGHGNDLEVETIDGVTTLFVPTSKAGNNSLVRYTISGSTAKKVGNYTITCNGSNLGGGSFRVLCHNEDSVDFLFKSGVKFYKGTLPVDQTSGTLEVTYLFEVDTSFVYINDVYKDLSEYVMQGVEYYDHRLYVIVTGHATANEKNVGIILTYDFEGASGIIQPLSDPTFCVTSGSYSALFEMEGCGIDPENGRMYFSVNRRVTDSDTNHDGVCYITNWTYEPFARNTEVKNYRWEMIDGELVSVTNGGSEYNGIAMYQGSIVDGKISNGKFAMSENIVLQHDLPWVLEWKSNGCSAGELLFATQSVSNYANAPYIFVNGNYARISIGAHDGSQYNNYGVTLADHGIDGTQSHVYRLTNKIGSDGSNMVYLSVDGRELGAMNNHFIASTSQGTTSNWVSGQDFCFSYLGTGAHKVNDSLEYIQVWGNGLYNQYDEPNTYRWEDKGSGMVNISEIGLSDNALTSAAGTYSGGVYTAARFEPQKPIVLLHNRPWSVEWKSVGTWSGGSLLFASDEMSKTYQSPYIFRNGSIIAIGAHNGSGYHHYGIKLSDHGISNDVSHVYRLTNKVSEDGSNMVYLYVDGVELGAMNNHFIAGTAQGVTSDWVSGRDFYFTNLGTFQHPINSVGIDYIQVWEAGIPEEKTAEHYRWETQSDTLVNISSGGFASNEALVISGGCVDGVYSGSQFMMEHSVALLHNQWWSIEWESEGEWTGGALMLSSSMQSSTKNNMYLFRSGVIAFGTHNGSNYDQYGITLSDYGINRADHHVYRLQNRLYPDGSNMVFLYADGVELGAMEQHFVNGAVTSDPVSDWVSGKDFVFSYIGTIRHPINNATVSYLQIDETCAHSFDDWVTLEATCTEQGSKTRQCKICTEVETVTLPVVDHSWKDATCTSAKTCLVCGSVEGEALEHDYQSTVTAPTCTEAGYTTHICTVCGASKVDSTVDATGHKWNGGYCYVCGAVCNHSFSENVCENCGMARPVTVPTLTPVSPSLSFESEVFYNIYFTVDDLTDVVQMGLLTSYDSIVDENDTYVEGFEWDASKGMYRVRSNGIPAKQLGDVLYFEIYAQLTDGSYVYSSAYGYSAVAYAKDRLANSDNVKMKALCVAMLNYGAAAQAQFEYKTDELMNSFLTAEQRALVSPYSAEMVDGLVKVDASKVGVFAGTGGFSGIAPNVAFEGAFAINLYVTPSKTVDANMTLYYWTVDDYNAVDILTAENASGVVSTAETTVAGQYMGTIEGIAAKQIDQSVFFAAVYESGGVTYCTGVYSYSLASYCMDRISNGSAAMQAFAKETIVYGYYAKNYFSS